MHRYGPDCVQKLCENTQTNKNPQEWHEHFGYEVQGLHQSSTCMRLVNPPERRCKSARCDETKNCEVQEAADSPPARHVGLRNDKAGKQMEEGVHVGGTDCCNLEIGRQGHSNHSCMAQQIHQPQCVHHAQHAHGAVCAQHAHVDTATKCFELIRTQLCAFN